MPQASASHPASKAIPPSGVMAPSQGMPVSTSRYRLPLNSTVPPTNIQPESRMIGEGQRLEAHATASSESA